MTTLREIAEHVSEVSAYAIFGICIFVLCTGYLLLTGEMP